MIVFHEGLPGAGKSYEAVLTFIVPALRDGKHVYTNVRGVDADAIAKYLGIAPVFLRDRLHLTSPDATPEEALQSPTAHLERQKAFFLAAGTDCLIVWDEIQDFFPKANKPVEEQWSEFVAAHRHAARHIVLMGQDVRDVHHIWRRRVEQLVRFRKLSMIGKGNGYRWEIFQNKGGDSWESMDSGFRKYDPKVFALYQSIRHGQTNHALLKHDKANPLARSWFLRYGLPAFLLFAGWGIYTINGIFSGEVPLASAPAAKPQPAKHAPPAVPSVPAVSPADVAPGQPPAHPFPVSRPGELPPGMGGVSYPRQPIVTGPVDVSSTDRLDDLLRANVAQVAGVVMSEQTGAWHADVVVSDSSGRVLARFNRVQLQALSAGVALTPYGLQVRTLSGSTYDLLFRVPLEPTYTAAGAVTSYHRMAPGDAARAAGSMPGAIR